MNTVYAVYMLGIGDDEDAWELVCVCASEELAKSKLEQLSDESAEESDGEWVPEVKFEPVEFIQ